MKTKNIEQRKTLRLPPPVVTEDFLQRFHAYCLMRDRSQSWVIVSALEYYMHNVPALNKEV